MSGVRRVHPAGKQRGSVPWYVPQGAEFDFMIELEPERRASALRATHTIHWLDNPWHYARDEVTLLIDVGIDHSWQPVYWDEVEEWDDIIPVRDAIRTPLNEFSDYSETHGLNRNWPGPTDEELRRLERDELDQTQREYEAEAAAKRKAKAEAKAVRVAAKRAKREREAARKAKSIAKAVTVPRTMTLRDLFG